MFNTGKVSPDFIVLDVSGVCYRLMKKRTRRFQSSLFYRLLNDGSHNVGRGSPSSDVVWLAPNRFFVQRSPALFDIVLQYYISGKLHLPSWACKAAIAEELAFWKLKPEHLCNVCCDKEHYDDDDDNSSYNDEHVERSETNGVVRVSANGNERQPTIRPMLNKLKIYKYRLWTFCERPHSSKGAFIFMVISMLFIIISTLNLIIGSIPQLQFCPATKKSTLNSTVFNRTNDFDESSNKIVEEDPDDQLFGFKSSCTGTRVFEWIDLICIIYFTVEIVIRFLACPTIRQYFTTPLHIVDLLATVPYYIELIIWAIDGDNHAVQKASTVLFLLLVLRNLRVLRILKMARYSRGLRALAITLKAAKKELFLLLSVLLLCVIIFSSIVYQLEKDVANTAFTSIPAAGWWCVGTISLVGFGDMSPKTTGGKAVASLVCVLGILIIAFPISVFVEHFTATYKNQATLSILKRGKNSNNNTGDVSEMETHLGV